MFKFNYIFENKHQCVEILFLFFVITILNQKFK